MVEDSVIVRNMDDQGRRSDYSMRWILKKSPEKDSELQHLFPSYISLKWRCSWETFSTGVPVWQI